MAVMSVEVMDRPAMPIATLPWLLDASLTIVQFVVVQPFTFQTRRSVFLGMKTQLLSNWLTDCVFFNHVIAQVRLIIQVSDTLVTLFFTATRIFAYPPDPVNIVTQVTHFAFVPGLYFCYVILIL
jgi:hypothetical protein